MHSSRLQRELPPVPWTGYVVETQSEPNKPFYGAKRGDTAKQAYEKLWEFIKNPGSIRAHCVRIRRASDNHVLFLGKIKPLKVQHLLSLLTTK